MKINDMYKPLVSDWIWLALFEINPNEVNWMNQMINIS